MNNNYILKIPIFISIVSPILLYKHKDLVFNKIHISLLTSLFSFFFLSCLWYSRNFYLLNFIILHRDRIRIKELLGQKSKTIMILLKIFKKIKKIGQNLKFSVGAMSHTKSIPIFEYDLNRSRYLHLDIYVYEYISQV